jgi:hypothetical protein
MINLPVTEQQPVAARPQEKLQQEPPVGPGSRTMSRLQGSQRRPARLAWQRAAPEPQLPLEAAMPGVAAQWRQHR